MLFDNVQGLVRVAIVAILAYASLIAVLRIVGKRSLAKFNAFDLVVTVALGSTLATVLLTKDVASLEGALAFAMLALLQWLVSRASVASTLLRSLVRSRPRLLLQNGGYCIEAMRKERAISGEIDAAVRSAGIGRIDEVAAVVLETDGSLSVLARRREELTLLRNVEH